MKNHTTNATRLVIFMIAITASLSVLSPTSLSSKLIGFAGALTSPAGVGKTFTPQAVDHSTVQAAGRGAPFINFSDGQIVTTTYSGERSLLQGLAKGSAQPLALASADFDEDGVPDLISAYSGSNGGIVTLHRGNVDSIYPNAPEAQDRKKNREFADSPFLPSAEAFEIPEAANFVGAGDFDGDSHWDVVATATGSSALYLLSGDGHGGLGKAQRLELPGRVTTMITGEVNRADGLDDIVVGVVGDAGPRVLVFESPEGAFKAEPEAFSLPAEAKSMALGLFDDSYEMDLAVAAGSELVIVRGRDRKLSSDEIRRATVPPASLYSRSFQSGLKSLAAGDFKGEQHIDVAALLEDGSIQVVSERKIEGKEVWTTEALATGAYPRAKELRRVKVSTRQGDDLVVLDPVSHQLHITLGKAEPQAQATHEDAPIALDVEGEPAAVLSMRLNRDAMNDLVVLEAGKNAPTVLPTAVGRVFTATNTTDSGVGSLRQAIVDANANAGMDAIDFDFVGSPSSTQTITLLSALPVLTEAVLIDGTTSLAGQVELNGNSSSASAADGLTVAGGSSIVRGMVINRCGDDGIQLASSNNIVEGNKLGTDQFGANATGFGNFGHGVRCSSVINNRIGGTKSAARNIIFNNRIDGVLLTGGAAEMNQVQGNVLGASIAGPGAPVNPQNGIRINNASNNTVGGTAAGARNVISGNVGGLLIVGAFATGNLIQGNFIGTDVSGTVALGNGQQGVQLSDATDNTIGGTSARAGNLISGNPIGVEISSAAAGNLVQGNFIGTDVNGTADLGNNFYGMLVNGPNNTIGGTSPGAGNLISGNDEGGVTISGSVASRNLVQGNFIGTDVDGSAPLGNRSRGVLIISASNNSIGGASTGAGNLISGNDGFGVQVEGFNASDNLVQGNYIGTDVNGTADLGNNQHGVRLSHATNNTIGGAIAGARNLISGNGQTGVLIQGVDGSGNKIQGNYIGTDKNGTADLGNTSAGVWLAESPNNTIGGEIAGAGNLISGNNSDGVLIYFTSGSIVQGNYIGTDVNGNVNLGNFGNGVSLNGAPNNTIGGASAEARNIISGNDEAGIKITGLSGSGNSLRGNYVGTNVSGTVALGNRFGGVILDFAPGNTIGGTSAGEGNLISGNNANGIQIDGAASTGNLIQGNFIGTDFNGFSPLRNAGNGVAIYGGSGNTIGGDAGNRIANNGQNGVGIQDGSGNRVSANLIFSNSGLGIDLGNDGVTPNDPGDSDSGANNLQNYPIINSISVSGGITTIRGTINSRPDRTFLIEFFSNISCDDSGNGEGLIPIGSDTTMTNSNGDASFTATFPGEVPFDRTVTATATVRTAGAPEDTSEFSPCKLLVNADLLVAKTDSPDPVGPGELLTYTIAVTNNGPAGAPNVTLKDMIPANTTFQSLSAPGWTTTNPSPGGSITCTRTSMGSGETSTITLAVLVNPFATPGQTISSTANVSSQASDPDPSNNAATTTTIVSGNRANLSVTNSDSPDPVVAGENLTYTITVTNSGPDAATNVTLNEATPDGTTFQSATASGWTYTPPVSGTGSITFTKASMASGETNTITLVVRVDPGATGLTISNTATVSSAASDPDTSNNAATTTTTVSSSADLLVTISDSPDPVEPSQNLTYTITVTNIGPSEAASIKLDESTPNGTTFQSATAPGWNFTPPPVGDPGTINFTKARMASGEINTIMLVVRVDASVAGQTIGNLATVSSQTPDPKTNNNTATTSTAVSAIVPSLVVTNTNDSGAGSLRAAISQSNSTPGREKIVFNIPTSDPGFSGGVFRIRPNSVLPAISNPVIIDGYTQPGASANTLAVGNDAVLLIELSGINVTQLNNTYGILITAGTSTVRGLVINRFRHPSANDGSGIILQSGNGNVVEGCFLGADPAGTTAVFNTYAGVLVTSQNNLIGGTTPAARNVISGNGFIGLSLEAPNNLVQGNYIGTTATGTAALGNLFIGVSVASNTTVGGTTAAARNVISGNQNDIQNRGGNSSNITIQGNYIGTNAAGSAGITITNGTGISLGTATNVTIGGLTATPGVAPGNVISGHTSGSGIQRATGSVITILGNLIGTNASGTAALGNGIAIRLQGGTGAIIGGTNPQALNVISGNGVQGGIELSVGEAGATVQGNYIGVALDGTTVLGNGNGGSGNNILLDSSSNNTIGGTAGAANIIAGGQANNVEVTGNSIGNSIRGNSIFSAASRGIDLRPLGVTPNDSCDADTGPNNLQNFPVLTSASSSVASTTIVGTLNSTANTAFILDFYSNPSCALSGEGRTHIGSITVTTDDGCNAGIAATFPVSLPAGQVITATATDPAHNTSEFSNCVQITSGSPNQAPVARCRNVEKSVDQNCQAVVTAQEVDNGSTDPDGNPITMNLSPAGPYPVGTTTVTLTLTDSLGASNSCSATVTIRDTTPPTITCPANIAVSAGGQCSATVTFSVNVSDNCSGATVIASPPSGTVFPVGMTTVTATATDAAGNTTTCSFTVTVKDTQAPTISCPGNITRSTDPNLCTGVVTFSPTVSDNCSGAGAATCTPASGATFPKGITTVVCSVTDGAGNTASCSFDVKVADSQAPAVACSNVAAQSASIGANCLATVPDVIALVRAQASDNCTAASALGITQSPAANTTVSGSGSHPITVTVTDVDNNSTTCVVAFTLNDTTPPTIACPASIIRATDSNLCSAVVTFAPTATDNCSSVGTPSCTPPSGTAFPKGTTTVTCTVKDAANNSSAPCSFTVTVNDTQSPVIACPANISVPAATGLCAAVVTYATPGVTDNCPNPGVVTCTPPSGSTFGKGPTTVNCSVRDAANNPATCAFSVSVLDTQAPTIVCPASIISNTINAGDSSVAVNFAPSATDNCSGVSVACVPPSGSAFQRGTTTVTCTATDVANNQKTCAFTVRIFDYVMVDDTNGKILRFDSVTGDYDFLDCRKATSLSGIGAVTKTTCRTELRHLGGDPKHPDRNVFASANPCIKTGTATITYAGVTHTLNDPTLSNNIGRCP